MYTTCQKKIDLHFKSHVQHIINIKYLLNKYIQNTYKYIKVNWFNIEIKITMICVRERQTYGEREREYISTV